MDYLKVKICSHPTPLITINLSCKAWKEHGYTFNDYVKTMSEIQTRMDFRHSLTDRFPNILVFRQMFKKNVSENQTHKI